MKYVIVNSLEVIEVAPFAFGALCTSANVEGEEATGVALLDAGSCLATKNVYSSTLSYSRHS